MSNERLTIKVSLAEDIRRISVDLAVSFSELTNLVHQLFSITEKDRYSLLYIDNEEDNIKLSSDVELEEAKRVTSKSEPKTLRLIIKQNENKKDTSKDGSSLDCCEECPLMKYIGIGIFGWGFYCRPALALCFLVAFLVYKRWSGSKRNKCCRWSCDGCPLWNYFDNSRSPSSASSSSSSRTSTEDEVKEVLSEEEKKEKSSINWQSLLKQLQDMGFSNVKQNIQLLNKHNGNIDNVVAELVQLAQ